MEAYLRKEAKKIDLELKKFFPRKMNEKWLKNFFGETDFVFDKKTLTESVCVPVWDFLGRGGKRWRPVLMLLCCEAVGGNRKTALPFTVIPELAHNGSIISDDVEDETDFRRGKPAIHKIYGSDLAVNIGSLLYFLPLGVLFRNHSLSEGKSLALYNVFAEEMLKLSFGQSMDIYWHQGKKPGVSQEEYLQMCAFKTGTLARMAAKFGAIIGGASKTQVIALGDFASTIGVAFQIQDDILNISSHKNLGKEFGDDISEGKHSLLVIHAVKNSSAKDAKRLLRILKMHSKDPELIKEAIGIIESAGSIAFAKGVARSLVENSWKKLDKKIPQSSAKEKLKEFADFLINRDF